MNFFKKLREFFVRPPLIFLFIIGMIAVGSVVCTALFLTQAALSDYVVWGYAFSVIMLLSASYLIYGIVKVTPDVKERVTEWAENKPFFKRLLGEYGFRTIILSIGSTVITLAFAVYNCTVAIIIRSVWFGALAAYYVLILALRAGILLYHSKRRRAIKNGQLETQTQINDTRQYRICGIILTLLPVCLSVAIAQMVIADDSFVHTGITIYVYALYAFYKIITAIVNVVKTLRTQEMTVRASRNISLADAFVSILALQTAMLKEFSSGAGIDNKTANIATGAVVCALTAALGIFMIINGCIRIRKLKKDLN